MAAITRKIHCSKTVVRSVSTTFVISGSNTPRKSGANAAPITAPVAATAALGNVNSQFATEVPIEASGERTRSGPTPRS
jgi:hypothetical protein